MAELRNRQFGRIDPNDQSKRGWDSCEKRTTREFGTNKGYRARTLLKLKEEGETGRYSYIR